MHLGRYYVRMLERACNDAQERAAMLNHRLQSIAYQADLLTSGAICYGFRTLDGTTAILLYEAENLDDLDRFIKRDPGFPYASVEVVPVINTEALVREAQEYLDEWIFKPEELPSLNFPKRVIENDATYWLAYKEVRPFSPLLTAEAQNDVHRRTILAQEAHLADLEFADENPVGKSVGILVAQCPSLETVKAHVQDCEVFPDTIVSYTQLLPFPQAWKAAAEELRALRRPVPDFPFGQQGLASSAMSKEADNAI